MHRSLPTPCLRRTILALIGVFAVFAFPVALEKRALARQHDGLMIRQQVLAKQQRALADQQDALRVRQEVLAAAQRSLKRELIDPGQSRDGSLPQSTGESRSADKRRA